MKKDVLKHQISVYLSTVLLIEVASYIITNFAYMSGVMPKIESQVIFYGTAVFMPFLMGWISFIIPYVIIRKCQKCGSKNISSQRMGFESPVCDDCGHVFKSNNTAKTIISFLIPFLFFGPSFLLGNVLAGETLDINLAFWSILLSSWTPSVLAEFIYAIKLNNSTFGKEHNTLSSILLLISFFVFPILMLIGYGMIIAEILKILGILY